jgi:predicted translin family RNA/ssDNA-binding protein
MSSKSPVINFSDNIFKKPRNRSKSLTLLKKIAISLKSIKNLHINKKKTLISLKILSKRIEILRKALNNFKKSLNFSKGGQMVLCRA